MATKRHSSVQAKKTSGKSLTLADTYGLGLIAYAHDGSYRDQIVSHLSTNAKKLVSVVTPQGSKKKTATKHRAALKR